MKRARVRRLHAPITSGQNSVAGGVRRARPRCARRPRGSSIAMSQRTPSHCAAMRASSVARRRAQRGRERVELGDVRPRREVRVAAVGEIPSARRAEGRGVARDVVLGAADVGVRALREPRVVGRGVVGDVVEDQVQPVAASDVARGGEPRRATEAGGDDVVAHAVGRADDVAVGQVRQGRADSARSPGRRRDRQPAGRAPRRPSARRRRPAARRCARLRRRARRRGQAAARAAQLAIHTAVLIS